MSEMVESLNSEIARKDGFESWDERLCTPDCAGRALGVPLLASGESIKFGLYKSFVNSTNSHKDYFAGKRQSGARGSVRRREKRVRLNSTKLD